jgi:hypothetical protein
LTETIRDIKVTADLSGPKQQAVALFYDGKHKE